MRYYFFLLLLYDTKAHRSIMRHLIDIGLCVKIFKKADIHYLKPSYRYGVFFFNFSQFYGIHIWYFLLFYMEAYSIVFMPTTFFCLTKINTLLSISQIKRHKDGITGLHSRVLQRPKKIWQLS